MEKDRTTSGAYQYPATGIIKTQEVIVTRAEGVFHGGRPDSAQVHKKASFTQVINQRPITMTRVHRPSGSIDPNKAALKYCKCAMLFFIALIITWVPSTINRIYTIVRPDDVIFGLNIAAAIVLPLQGFWNAVIYMATSSFAVKCLWQEVCHLCGPSTLNSSAFVIRRRGASLRSNELEDRSSKLSIHTTPYDIERSSSQSELVRQAKF